MTFEKFEKIFREMTTLRGRTKPADRPVVLQYYKALEKYDDELVHAAFLQLAESVDSSGYGIPQLSEILFALTEIIRSRSGKQQHRYCKYCGGSGVIEYDNKAYACQCDNPRPPQLPPAPGWIYEKIEPTICKDVHVSELASLPPQSDVPIRVVGLVCSNCGNEYSFVSVSGRPDLIIKAINHGTHLCEQCYEEEGAKRGFWMDPHYIRRGVNETKQDQRNDSEDDSITRLSSSDDIPF